jgi:hypothetical protein
MGYYDDTINMIFSDSQAITASADATNVIDTQSTPTLKDLGQKDLFVRLIVTEAFNTLTSLTIECKSDSTTNLDTSETVHVSKSVALAALTLGAEFSLTLPVGQDYERYLGMEYTVVGSNPTTGKITAILVPSVTSRQYFADGSSIS